MTARRPHLELYIRWMQEVRLFEPSTVSRRFSVAAGFYRTCDFALVAMLGLIGLRIFEATGADIADLGEEHGHRVLRVYGKGTDQAHVSCGSSRRRRPALPVTARLRHA